MTPRAIRRAAERQANKLATKAGASPAQLSANQANAQLSSGPKTEAGRAKACLNAVTSALTGQTVLLPSDDAAQYSRHVAAYAAQFRPVGSSEAALVQSLADTDWRLRRILPLESAIFAKGRIDFADLFEEEDPAVRACLIDAQTLLTYERQFRNLHLQESRLRRCREKETAELRRLQQARAEREIVAAEIAAKRAVKQADKPYDIPGIGFEFSTAENAAATPPRPIETEVNVAA